MGETVDVKREGAIARVVMHRKGINAMAGDLTSELVSAFEELGKDPEVRVIVLASEYEKYFSVGADLGEMGGLDRSADDAADQIEDDDVSGFPRCNLQAHVRLHCRLQY